MANLTSPDIEMVLASFVIRFPMLSWGEVLWGYNAGIFGWWDVVQIAKNN